MPISREEFESGQLDLTVPIKRALEANPDFAFSAQEIQERLADIVERNATEAEVAQQLNNLVEEGVVEVKALGGRRWYIIITGREAPDSPMEQ